MNDSPAVQSSTSISSADEDSSIGSTSSRAPVVVDSITKGNNDEEENERKESKTISTIKSIDSSNKIYIDTLARTLHKACYAYDWKQIKDFFSDKSISNQVKRTILQNKNVEICKFAIGFGAPLHIIKNMIELMDPKSAHFLTSGDSDCSWLHFALRFSHISGGFYISFDAIELLVSSGGKRLVNMQSNCKSDRKRTPLQVYLHRGSCPKIINLLLEVGGLELLEIEDEDGYSVRDFSNKPQRKIIVDYLKTLKECPRVQKHIEAFKDTAVVTPKDFFDWNMCAEFDQVRTYLDSEKVSTEAKMKCINFDCGIYGRPFHSFCKNHGPIDIAKKFFDIVGKDLLFLKDTGGNNCLHLACENYLYDDEDGDNEAPIESDIDTYCKFVAFLLSRGGSKLLLEANNEKIPALYNVMMCKLTNLECVKLVVQAGGDKLLAFQDTSFLWRVGGNTILHYASEGVDPDREVIKYLVSVGGTRLTEIENDNYAKAEDEWSDELKEYIAFTTKTLPALSDDLQCPICFDTLFDVHVISKCCHRFCKKCITQSYEKRGNNCPVCRAEYSIRDVKRDPLLGKLALAVKEEKDKNELFQTQLSESQKENQFLREQLQNALKRKRDEL
ncbi:hypothetical protein CTEN210_02827 [Chaetoceros tenuissimus]|uniref:RING-type domain-containing protein n=1 Tax=Chaetoceros tenuissimus TaxID=426638 RepID=A0AAD3H172_9STRA|nr:hypothetical protein CTEN210_02827 [Chaetoceros tenuissimus]